MSFHTAAQLDFDRSVRRLLDAQADLAEDLAERAQNYTSVVEGYRSIVKSRETVRAACSHFDDLTSTTSTSTDTDPNNILFKSISDSVIIKFNRQPDYVAMMERVWAVEHPEQRMPDILPDGRLNSITDTTTDDFSVTAEHEKLTCPITLKPFEEPVRAECGHVFEKRAIEQLATTSTFKCPIGGCNRIIRLAKLLPDTLMKRRVLQSQRRRLI